MWTRALIVLCVLAAVCLWRFQRPPPPASATQNETSFSSTPSPEKPAATTQPSSSPSFVKAVAAHPGKPITLPRRSSFEPSVTQFSQDRFPRVTVGPEITMNDRKQKIVGLRAVPKSSYSASYGPVLFEQNGFSVVGLNTVAEPGWDDLIMRMNDRPVVVDPNGRIGIVTGTLIVKLSDARAAEKLAGREDFQLLFFDEVTTTAYFRAPENYHILSGAAKLAQSEGVIRVEIEIAQGRKELQ